MEKRKKSIILGIIAATAVVAVALLLFLAKGYKIRFEDGFSKDLSFEYGKEADLPKAYVTNMFGIRQFGKVKYQFVSPEGKETTSSYPVAACDSVGDWKLTCTYKNAKTEKDFQVVDTVAPEIIIGELPSDVYVGNTDMEYTVPAVDIKDASPIDYNKCQVSLYFEGEEAKYNELTKAFVPEKDGEYVYKIKAVDIYGNTSKAECKWRSKDPNWQDPNLPDGYLATFDSVGYANLISSGFINEYWNGTETEEFLEEYKGETGVMKVTARCNSLGFASFKVKLARTITPEQLGNNVIIVRYRVDDKKAEEGLNLAGNYQENIKSAAAKTFKGSKGEWQTATLTAEDLTKYQYTDEDRVLRTLTFGLTGRGKNVDIYLASITIGRKLDAPQNLYISGGTLRWNAVKDAVGYSVYTEGAEKEEETTETSYQAGGHKLFKVRAKGDGLFTVDSRESIYVNDTPAAGYLAEFDEEYYQYLVWNNGTGAEGGMDWYECDEFAATYDDKENAVRLDMTRGYVSSGIVVRLPKSVKTSSLDSVVIRFKADENVKRVTVYQYGGPALLADVKNVTAGWNTIVVPKKMLTGDADNTSMFSGYQMMFYEKNEPEQGPGQGTKMTVYLSSVTKATQLAAPSGLAMSGKKLTWNGVAHAQGYVVVEDGEKVQKVSGTSYTSKGGELFQVKAVGDNKFYVDSEDAIYVNGKVTAGYLAEFNRPYYAHLVWNNGADAPGGMQWYQSDSFQATYDSGAGALRVDMTMGYVGAGCVIRFPKSAKVSEFNDMVIRVHLDSAVKGVAVYQYGGVGRMNYTENVKPGWNNIVIPRSSLLADGGSDDIMSGIQLILYGGGGNGADQGKKTTMYLGSITNAVKLGEPQNLKLEGNTLSWDKVTGAIGYEVIEDGRSTTVKTNSYTIHGGNLLKVAALGDGLMKVSSGYAIYVNATVPAGYIATFDKPFYEYLIWNNGANTEGGMQWYESDSHKVTYEASTGLTRVDMTMGYVCAGSVIKFPRAVKLSEIDDMIVRVKLDSTVKKVGFYQYGGVGNIYHTEAVAPGWNTIVIPKSKLLADAGSEETMSGIQLILYGAGGNGDAQGQKTTMYLGYIASIRKLDTPTNIKVQGNTLTWDAVDGAVKYIVYEDGQSYFAQTNSHTLHDGELIKIQAVGDGKVTSDSELALYINAKVKEGYLAEFNKEYYNYLIWNNGGNMPGGLPWYDSASFSASFNKTGKVMDVTAQYGFVAAAMVIKFPQGGALEAGKDVVVNLKVDDTVKNVRIYPYGLTGRMYEDKNLQIGWNQIVIPADKVAAAVGENTFDGLQIMLADNVEGEFTQSSPAKTAHISIGIIHYAESLKKPELTVDGTTLTWDAVDNADAYDIYVNDEKVCTQSETDYSLAGLATGVYSIKVAATSEKEIYLPAVSVALRYSNLEILSVPEMTYSDGTVSFATVAGAAGYKIEIDGTVYDIDKSATSVKPADLIGKSVCVKYRMMSVGDNVTTVDSEWSDYQTQDLSLEESYIADFDEGYGKLVWNNGANAEGGQAWYESDAFGVVYDEEEKGMKLTLKHGYVCAGFVTKFPNPIRIEDTDNLVLRIKLDENIKKLAVFEYGGTGAMLTFTDLQAGWNELVIPKSDLKNDPGKDYISGLQIVMNTSNNPTMGDSQGRDITVVLGSVKKMTVQIDEEEKEFTRTENGIYDDANTIYLVNNEVYGNISSAADGVTVLPVGESSGVYVNGVLDNNAVFATAPSWSGVFWLRPSTNAASGTVLTLKGVFRSPDGSYQFAVKESAWQYDGSKWNIYDEAAATKVVLTPDGTPGNANVVYVSLSGLSANQKYNSEGGSVKLNGETLNNDWELDYAFNYAGWGTVHYIQLTHIDTSKNYTFTEGSKLTIGGIFKGEDGKYIDIEEVTLICHVSGETYSWSVYDEAAATKVVLTPDGTPGNANVVYVSLSGLSANQKYNPEGGSVKLNGETLNNDWELDYAFNYAGWGTVHYIQLTHIDTSKNYTFTEGSKLTIGGIFKGADGKYIDIEEVTLVCHVSGETYSWSVYTEPTTTYSNPESEIYRN